MIHTIVDLPVIHPTETVQLAYGLLSEMEIVMGIGSLERHKATGPDGLSLSFFKELLTLGSLRAREQIPKE